MRSDKILKEFGNHIGVRNMIFDHQRSCSLMINKDNVIIINDIQDTSIMISCIIGPVSKQQISDSKTAMELLSMNMLFAAENGPYVGYEPNSSALVLSVTNNHEEMSPLIMESQISYLLQNKQHVTSTLAERGINLI